MAKSPKDKVESDYTQKEAEDRRDAILKRMLSTPPKPKSTKAAAKKKGKG